MTRGIPTAAVLLVFAGEVLLAEKSLNAADSQQDWKLSRNSGNVELYTRMRDGSKLQEFKAVGEIDASSRSVYAVIDDLESYVSFMPYMAECRLVKRESDASLVTYQRLSPKICQDRDYTLRVWKKSWGGPDGLFYSNRWEPANELGPAEKTGVVRVKVCEGSWLLEPVGAVRTRAIYSLYTDTGGSIPAFISNRVNQLGIGRIFSAIRKQVKNPKYDAQGR